jgi:SAM-dependent methyltransferase
VSDSAAKLARLRLPARLDGARALDVGCNEGFFCNALADRGAKVLGIDRNRPALDFARESYDRPEIEFRLQGWDDLPEGPFDLVLWASAMHYEPDPRKVLDGIARRLAPDGVLVLECGAFDQPQKEMIRVNRQPDTRWYPTVPYLLDELLAAYAVRRMSQPQTTPGDPVPRYVFHCRRPRPTVLLVRGGPGSGKTSLAKLVAPGASKTISLDWFIGRIGGSNFPHSELDQLIKQLFEASNGLGPVYRGIDEAGMTREWAALIAETVLSDDRLVVIEGAMTDAQADALEARLGSSASVWDARRPD